MKRFTVMAGHNLEVDGRSLRAILPVVRGRAICPPVNGVGIREALFGRKK